MRRALSLSADLTSAPPRVWLLLGHKAGDNAQVLALAEALGWPFEVKRLIYRKTELLTNGLPGGTLWGIARAGSSPLQPPWPDLVITAGRRNEPVARWIQRQAGGSVRLVHLGRPWAKPECFDLIVTTPQYRLPEQPNILHNTLPLHRVTADKLAEAAALWSPRLAHLARPAIALLVGGNSGPYTLDPDTADYLGRAASRMAAGGSLLVSTSARTPPAAAEALQAALDVPSHFFRWSPGVADNPYFGYLALADAFIVTGDSMSMLTEACVTRKPVYIFDLGPYPPSTGLFQHWRQRLTRFRFQALIHRLAMRFGPRRMARDVGIIHRHLIAAGRAAWLGQPFPGNAPPPLDDVQRAAARVRALFQDVQV